MANNRIKIEMTRDQLNTLVFYILTTTKYRKSEAEAWSELANETDENGQPKYPNAKSNAQYYQDLECKLEEITKILDR